jgi:TonB-dependent receptor
MVSRISNPASPAIIMPWKQPVVSPAQRMAALLVIFSLVLPPGRMHGAPVEDPSSDPSVIENSTSPPENLPPVEAPAAGADNPLQATNPAAANCIITGEVSDATSLNPLAGAIIDAVGTDRSATSDSSGKFRIDGLSPGTYTLEASKLGYFSETSDITAIEAQPAEARFSLRLKPADDLAEEYTLEEETVVGEYQGDSQGDLFLDLQLTPSIASGLSKDDFSRSGIGDAGDAVAKISGANIVGGKYAVVRGLGDRYSNTLVNGASISSADPTKKAVQLDLFPSDLLESISIFKTFVPELPAEFAGGTVFIKTLQFPDKPIIKVEYGRKNNSQLSGDFYGSGEDLGYFGRVDDGLPSSVPSLESGEWTAGTSGGRPPAPDNPTAQKAISQATALHLSSPLRPTKRDSKIPESFSMTLGNTFNLPNNLQLGVVLAGTSSNGDQAERDVVVGRSLNSGEDGKTGTGDDFLNRTQTEDRYIASAGYGILGSFGLKAGDRHQITTTFFQNYQAEDEVTLARKIRDDTSGSGEFGDYAGPGSLPTGQLTATPFGATAATFRALDSIAPLRRELTLSQLGGHHEFGDEERPVEVDWLYSSNQATEERPATRTVFFSELDFTDPSIAQNVTGAVLNPSLGQIFTSSDIFGINPALNQTFRETLSTEEESTNSRIDLTIPAWNHDENSLKFKVGGNRFDRSREVRGRFFTYNLGQPLNGRLAEEDDGQYGIDFLNGINGQLDPNGDPIFNGHASNNQSNGIFIQENTRSGNTVRNVDAGTDLIASYLQASLTFGKWDITGGARYESEDRSFEVFQDLNPAGTTVPFTTISNDYLLPGITVSRTFGEEDQFTTTLAWSRTVARPTFFEFAPIRTVDQASGDTFQGNSALTDTLIENYDLRWEWAPDVQSMLAFSLFYKSLDAPIAQTYGLGERTFVNGTGGTLSGIEIELQKRFFTHWSVTSNFTFIDSVLEFVQPPNQLVSSTFDGQPEYIYNLILGWDHKDSGWAATLNYNFTGSYLTSVPSSSVEPPVRREAYNQIDLVVQKKFEFEQGVGIVTLNIGNLLDAEDTESFDGTNLTYRSYRPGRTYGIKFEYEF